MDTEPPLTITTETIQTVSIIPQSGLFILLGLFFLLVAAIYSSGQGKGVLDGWTGRRYIRLVKTEFELRQVEKLTAKYFARIALFISYSCFFFAAYSLWFLGKPTMPLADFGMGIPVILSWLLTFVCVVLTEAFLPAFSLNLNHTYQKRIFFLLQWLWLPFLPVLYPGIKNIIGARMNNDVAATDEQTQAFRNKAMAEDSEEEEYPPAGNRDDYSRVNNGSFRYIYAKQIMCQRMDISAVPDNFTLSEVMDFITSTGYSRFPVYQGDLDTIIGILYVKDILPFVMEKGKVNWKKWVRKEVLFVPESIKIEMLLREFQNRRQHMAIIVDEYGGTSGIATLEDVIEELVGEIRDELDGEEEQVFQKLSDHQFLFDGKTLLQDVCRITGLSSGFFDSFRKEADSVGGLILEASGNLPLQGKQFQFGNVSLLVNSVNKSRIEKVRLEITVYEQD